jgi:beta-xylosidase
MLEAVMFWNEPNNLSHWDFEVDRDWSVYARMVTLAAMAAHAENPKLLRVLGGISPIDPAFIQRIDKLGALENVDIVALHGFPLDWNHWTIHEWPEKLAEIRAVTTKPIWVSEVGASSFGADEVQEFGLKKTAELLTPRSDHVYWYSLFDLPRAWPATTRHRESEGSSYYRHFYMGLFREDGSPKLAARHFAEYAPALGICQWFHFEDHRLETAVKTLRELGVRKLRTGLSWADFDRPNAAAWFDRQMSLLEPFELTITFCFTPERCGVKPHHTSPPRDVEEYASFCAQMIRRYAPSS